ncbi:helicase HerA domain-containing protein [Methanoplanus endosymbiosus]|uniref:DUF87 domain-containing protein n=1 Tax=Methanoplanus endosymbiosus TaxID=33865 RepID=A0A9E7PKY3_9EURY|nr:DUF87 domain-containing protein [Methanoplanus endosymbiosus]UUX92075.1 DUF87 domain-containing protein [Methanoplanus endosymbiosus]
MSAAPAWRKKLAREWIKVPGQHMTIVGTTGMGKTNALQFCIEGLSRFSDETIVIFDSGKSSELLVFSQFKPLNLIIPEGLDVDVSLHEKDNDSPEELPNGNSQLIRKSYIKKPEEIWDKLIKSRINIVCLEVFILDPEVYTQIIIQIFRNLIKRATRNNIITPLTIAIEEINRIAPGKGYAHSPEHNRLGAVIEHNIEYLRSLGIRFIGTQQGFKSVRLGVRQHFHWQIVKNGCRFSEGRLARYNYIWEGLAASQGVIVYPDGKYSDIISPFKYYGEGRDIGYIQYLGEIALDDSEVSEAQKNNEADDDDNDNRENNVLLLDDFLGRKRKGKEAKEAGETGGGTISPETVALLDQTTKNLLYMEAKSAGIDENNTEENRESVILEYMQKCKDKWEADNGTPAAQ